MLTCYLWLLVQPFSLKFYWVLLPSCFSFLLSWSNKLYGYFYATLPNKFQGVTSLGQINKLLPRTGKVEFTLFCLLSQLPRQSHLLLKQVLCFETLFWSQRFILCMLFYFPKILYLSERRYIHFLFLLQQVITSLMAENDTYWSPYNPVGQKFDMGLTKLISRC